MCVALEENSKMSFTGKVVVITGASSGIGADAARHLANLGANVVIVGRNAERLNAVVKEINNAGSPEPLAIVADVTKDADRVINQTISKFGKLDVLVNNAGILTFGPFTGLDIKSFDEILNTNVRSVILLTQAAIPHLEKTKGNIVNISSIAGIRPITGASAYCASKAALDMITGCLAIELGPKKIRVNSVNPGMIRTPIFQTSGIPEDKVPDHFEKAAKSYPIGRIGEVPDTSAAIAYLASDQASFVTGVLLRVDGGRVLAGTDN